MIESVARWPSVYQMALGPPAGLSTARELLENISQIYYSASLNERCQVLLDERVSSDRLIETVAKARFSPNGLAQILTESSVATGQ